MEFVDLFGPWIVMRSQHPVMHDMGGYGIVEDMDNVNLLLEHMHMHNRADTVVIVDNGCNVQVSMRTCGGITVQVSSAIIKADEWPEAGPAVSREAGSHTVRTRWARSMNSVKLARSAVNAHHRHRGCLANAISDEWSDYHLLEVERMYERHIQQRVLEALGNYVHERALDQFREKRAQRILKSVISQNLGPIKAKLWRPGSALMMRMYDPLKHEVLPEEPRMSMGTGVHGKHVCL